MQHEKFIFSSINNWADTQTKIHVIQKLKVNACIPEEVILNKIAEIYCQFLQSFPQGHLSPILTNSHIVNFEFTGLL